MVSLEEATPKSGASRSMLTAALKLEDCSPEVRRPFLPNLLTLACVQGQGREPTKESGKSRERRR